MEIKCVVCGKICEAQKSTKKYCSRSCEDKARAIRIKENSNKIKNAKGMIQKQCLICGESFFPKTPSANQRLCCYKCFPEGKQLLRSDFLDLIKKQYGGKCEQCGYSTYLGALDFHHKDPSQKDFTIGNRDFRLEQCIEEAKKCVLLCSNCHRELHAGLWTLNELNFKEEEEVEF